ncbi:MAG TPA: hypothetical protein VK389_00525 [Thermoanaerobaculia bacterium]|nr:hypothetical protein [Thermoanaerobaculia bacterium]
MSETISRYLSQSAEPEAALVERFEGSFGHAVEVPAYAETDSLFETLGSVPEGPAGEVLIVVVLNARADSPADVHDTNRIAREKIAAAALESRAIAKAPDIDLLSYPHGKVLLIDRASPGHFLSAGQGIGLARKIGCDLMLGLAASGRLASPWIHATDADVRLPNDYFEQIGRLNLERTSAAVYSFEHRFPPEEDLARAGRLFEISLRYNVLGLAWAGSPYAYQSLGSCFAIAPWAYAEVGGFPRVNAIEDVKIANDLAKIGSIERLAGAPIGLEGRISARVPVSTGQSLSKLVAKKGAAAGFELHHPIVFAHLAAWLRVLGAIARRGSDLEAPLDELPRGNPFFRADLLEESLGQMGAFGAVRDAIAQPGDEETVLRRLHVWFDAFRTRRLMDDLRDGGLVSLPLRKALSEAPFTGLGDSTDDDLETLRLLLAEEEKTLARVPAGVPALEPIRA